MGLVRQEGPLKLKGKFYKVLLKAIMQYESECSLMKK